MVLESVPFKMLPMVLLDSLLKISLMAPIA